MLIKVKFISYAIICIDVTHKYLTFENFLIRHFACKGLNKRVVAICILQIGCKNTLILHAETVMCFWNEIGDRNFDLGVNEGLYCTTFASTVSFDIGVLFGD